MFPALSVSEVGPNVVLTMPRARDTHAVIVRVKVNPAVVPVSPLDLVAIGVAPSFHRAAIGIGQLERTVGRIISLRTSKR